MLDRCNKYGMAGLWIRKVYKELIDKRKITAVVRLGDRSDPKHRNYIPSDVDLPVRFLRRGGQSGSDISGDFLFPDDGTTFRRTGCIVKKIADLTKEDLRGMAPDTVTPELVRYHLGTINDTELPGLDTMVTIWRFKYRPNAIG